MKNLILTASLLILSLGFNTFQTNSPKNPDPYNRHEMWSGNSLKDGEKWWNANLTDYFTISGGDFMVVQKSPRKVLHRLNARNIYELYVLPDRVVFYDFYGKIVKTIYGGKGANLKDVHILLQPEGNLGIYSGKGDSFKFLWLLDDDHPNGAYHPPFPIPKKSTGSRIPNSGYERH